MKSSLLTSTFVRFRDRFRGLAAGIVGNREEAEDVLHDAFCKLWVNHREIKNETEAIKLGYATVRYTALDSLRYRRSHPSVDEDSVSELSEDPEAEELKEREELYNILLSLSRKVLNERQYEVFILHDVENLSYPEIAERLGLTQENVRAILSRSRKAIREMYRKNNQENE